VLRALILSDNTGLTGSVQAITGPTSLQALHISNTSIDGYFDAGWMTRQSPQFTCLVAFNNPGLCGQLFETLPCSLTRFVQGTGLSKLPCSRSHIAEGFCFGYKCVKFQHDT
jgi:hypothetical protein